MDHDQRFKSLFQEFFPDFIRLFFGDLAELFDFGHIEWLEQELFADPPKGARRILDLVAKLRTKKAVSGDAKRKGGAWLALVHVEIESQDRVAGLPARMYDTYIQLRRRHQLPVLPIGLYLKVAKNGIGVEVYEERFGTFETLRFRYLYVGLPGLDALEYLEGKNWLGVALAALMRVPRERTAWLAAEALRRILQSPLTAHQQFLLGECVQAYLAMDQEQRDKFNRLITSPPYQGVKAMNVTWFEEGVIKGRKEGLKKGVEKGLKEGVRKGLKEGVRKGLKEGMEKGVEEGRREALRELLKERFGPLSPRVLKRLEQLPTNRLMPLMRAALRASSLKELGLDE